MWQKKGCAIKTGLVSAFLRGKMKKFYLAIPVILLLFSIGGSAALSAETKPTPSLPTQQTTPPKHPPLWHLAKYAGKLPDAMWLDPVDPKNPYADIDSIWEDPALFAAAERDLGKGFLEKALQRKTGTLRMWVPIAKRGSGLMIAYCRPQYCGFENIRFFVDMAKGTMAACLQGYGELVGPRAPNDFGPHDDIWIGNGGGVKRIKFGSCEQMDYYEQRPK